ncbi:MAG TPA: chromate resistance protein ChrB domain-containing protein [Xanthomonadales bacterium]|nr:chromate resistance protein ChrB domain-containing protein [Xanthomonadales bacterium]
MKWITRSRPVIDRIACPWLVARFIDTEPEFLFEPREEVFHVAARTGAEPYDIPGAALSHVGERCSFDAFLARWSLDDPALARLAIIVRGADTDRHDLAPQCAGLLAISVGMGRLHRDDHELLDAMFPIYDALLAWCREASDERHAWRPERAGA